MLDSPWATATILLVLPLLLLCVVVVVVVFVVAVILLVAFEANKSHKPPALVALVNPYV